MDQGRSQPESADAVSTGRFERYWKLSRLNYPVPSHGHRLPYVLGGIVFLGFLILFATGAVLTQFIDPDPERAYQSVQRLVEEPGGSWLRAMHYWTAQAMVLVLLLHVIRVVFGGSYKAPRTATWYVGVMLFGLGVYGAYFTGTVLKWDQEAFDALAHYREGLRWLGPLGTFLGSDDVLSLNIKLYVTHVSLLPLAIIVLLVLHFYLVNAHSLSPLPFGEDSARDSVPSDRMTGRMRDHVMSILFFGGLYFVAAALVAAAFPAPLGEPVTGEEMSLKPPWPFLWLYGLENITGRMETMFHAIGALALLAVALPLVDYGPDRNPSRRKPILLAVATIMVGMIGLTVYAAITPPQIHGHGAESGHGGDDHGSSTMEPEHGTDVDAEGGGQDGVRHDHQRPDETLHQDPPPMAPTNHAADDAAPNDGVQSHHDATPHPH